MKRLLTLCCVLISVGVCSAQQMPPPHHPGDVVLKYPELLAKVAAGETIYAAVMAPKSIYPGAVDVYGEELLDTQPGIYRCYRENGKQMMKIVHRYEYHPVRWASVPTPQNLPVTSQQGLPTLTQQSIQPQPLILTHQTPLVQAPSPPPVQPVPIYLTPQLLRVATPVCAGSV